MNYRKKANITLILVALGFIAMSVLRYFYRDIVLIKMLFYVTEAALIGGMADWFAVTAIFKKPLGFPYHTAIIPKNRATIVDSVVTIVEKEFLSAELLSERLNKVRITNKLINWIDSKAGKSYIEKTLISLLSNNEIVDSKRISGFINSLIRENADKAELDKYIKAAFERGLKNGDHKKVLEIVLDGLIKAAEAPEVKEKIFGTINKLKEEKTQGLLGALFNSALEGSNLVNISEITDSIHIKLMETLYELKNEEAPTSVHIMNIIEEHLTVSARNPFTEDQMEEIKKFIFSDLVSEEMVEEVLTAMLEELKKLQEAKDTDILDRDNNKLFYIITEQINITWLALKSNDALINEVEAFIKKSITNIINKEHSVIGKIVRDTLDSFSDEALNKFIEDRAGNDLQWIRINGSIVGGLVGLLVFLFLNYFYDPIAVPFIKSLF